MDHNKLGLDDSLIEATRAIVEKKLHPNQEKLDKQLDEMKHMGSYTQSHVMKKIKSGDWEASSDVKPNRHVELRHHSGKRITVKVEHDPVKEDVELVEGKKWSKLGYSSEHDYHKARYTHASGKKAPAGTSTMAMMVMADKAERESGKKLHEDVEQIDELSKATLKSYVKKASHDAAVKGVDHGIKKAERDEMDRNLNRHMSFSDKDKIHDIMKTTLKDVDAPREKAAKRLRGISKAVDKLTKEQLEEIEALADKHGLTKE